MERKVEKRILSLHNKIWKKGGWYLPPILNVLRLRRAEMRAFERRPSLSTTVRVSHAKRRASQRRLESNTFMSSSATKLNDDDDGSIASGLDEWLSGPDDSSSALPLSDGDGAGGAAYTAAILRGGARQWESVRRRGGGGSLGSPLASPLPPMTVSWAADGGLPPSPREGRRAVDLVALDDLPTAPSGDDGSSLTGGGGGGGFPSGGGGGGDGSPLNPGCGVPKLTLEVLKLTTSLPLSHDDEGCDASTALQFERERERVLGERDVGANAESRRHLAEAKAVAEAKDTTLVKEHLSLAEQRAQRQRARERSLDRLDRLDRGIPSLTYSLPLTAAAASPSVAAAVSDHRNSHAPASASTAVVACGGSTDESPFILERSSPFLALMEARQRFRKFDYCMM